MNVDGWQKYFTTWTCEELCHAMLYIERNFPGVCEEVESHLANIVDCDDEEEDTDD